MPPQIDDMRNLVALAELKDTPRTWSESARILNLDDGTLTNSMKRLVKEFKRTIWDLSGRYPVLTQEGAELYELTKKFLAAADAKCLVECLTIQVADSIASEILPRAMQEFLAAHRGKVSLRLRKLNYFSVRNDVMNGRVAFGIGWSFLAEQSDLIVPFKPAFDLVLITPAEHSFARSGLTRVTPGDLQNEMVFVLQPDLRMQKINSLLQHVPAENRVECTNYQCVLSHVSAGLGIGLVPGWRWILDKLQGKQALYYFMLPKQYRQRIVAFLPKGGVKMLAGPALALYQTIQKNIDLLHGNA